MSSDTLRKLTSYVWRLAYGLAVLLCLSGCAGLRPALPPPQSLAPGQLAKLNGSHRHTSQGNVSLGLANFLLVDKFAESPYQNEPNLSLTIKALSEREIQVSLFKDSTLVATDIRKGRVRDGCFVLKRQYKFGGIPGLVWGFYVVHSRLSLKSADTLLLDSSKDGMAFIIIIPAPAGSGASYLHQIPFDRQQL